VRLTCLYLVFCVALIANALLAEDCPKWGDTAAALKFLQENKPNGTAADPACVNRAFSTLSHDKASAKDLVELLDFERSTKNDDFKTYGGRYRAIGALMDIGAPAVPYLIKAVKESDSELVRTNAAEALGAIHRACADVAITMLEKEAAKRGTTGDQQSRLRAAQAHIRNNHHRPCKSSAS